MPRPALYAIDLVAVGLPVLGLYLPRHRRRDLVVAYLGYSRAGTSVRPGRMTLGAHR